MLTSLKSPSRVTCWAVFSNQLPPLPQPGLRNRPSSSDHGSPRPVPTPTRLSASGDVFLKPESDHSLVLPSTAHCSGDADLPLPGRPQPRSSGAQGPLPHAAHRALVPLLGAFPHAAPPPGTRSLPSLVQRTRPRPLGDDALSTWSSGVEQAPSRPLRPLRPRHLLLLLRPAFHHGAAKSFMTFKSSNNCVKSVRVRAG